MYILTQQTGIYKIINVDSCILTQQTGMYKMINVDSCIYNLRYMTDELKP